MSARRKGWLRHPRTTQERKCNQDKNDGLVRGKRRNLPTSYDDLIIPINKSWKSRRKKQYREDINYFWYEFEYNYRCVQKRAIFKNIIEQLEKIGCYYEYFPGGIRWFGPELKR